VASLDRQAETIAAPAGQAGEASITSLQLKRREYFYTWWSGIQGRLRYEAAGRGAGQGTGLVKDPFFEQPAADAGTVRIPGPSFPTMKVPILVVPSLL
jgi:hypothetical protein